MKFFTRVLPTITILTAITFLVLHFFRDDLYIFYKTNISSERKNIVIINNNYAKNVDYNYISLTHDFIAKDKQHLLNILWTIANSGVDKFSFYCDFDYKLCANDFYDIVNDNTILTNINNFVHPYNSFTKVTAITYGEEKIEVSLEHKYTDEDINKINAKVDQIILYNTNSSMSDTTKIEKIHNYIINNSKYREGTNFDYGKANHILIDHEGICSAYTDAMAIFLTKFNINNYRIASDTHIWNLVYINNTWLHLDLTYDDPVVSDGSNILLKDAFLITTFKLNQLNGNTHTFDKKVYSEVK